jgi:hypothetical protein
MESKRNIREGFLENIAFTWTLSDRTFNMQKCGRKSFLRIKNRMS